MRQIFVQNCETKFFLRDGDDWTPNPGEARNFETSLNALAHCLQNRLSDTQIIVRFNTPGAPDVIVPVQPDDDRAPRPRS